MPLSFDRVAHEYDATRGGEERGARDAAKVDEYLPAGIGLVLEIGIGTGVVAKALTGRGRRVVGVDISPLMLASAVERIGPRVAVGDASRLPVGDASVDAVIAVMVLHLVDDEAAVARAVGRVLKPGGVFVGTVGHRLDTGDPVSRVIAEINSLPRSDPRSRRHPEDWVETFRVAGFDSIRLERWPHRRTPSSPQKVADDLERRTWSSLWSLTAEQWQDEVVPRIARLRSLGTEPVEQADTTEILIARRP
jgi:ubiquinone/menaquinone biosynthesis C-methylase UbiE